MSRGLIEVPAAGAASTRGPRPAPVVDLVLVAAVVGVTALVHPLGADFRVPLWSDEQWVALLARAPFGELVKFSSSTPLGWMLLVRTVPGGHGQQMRIVPLLFSAATGVLAYGFVSVLPWSTVLRRRVVSTAAALTVTLVPGALLRNDLKQYTADSCFALVVLTLGCRVEQHETPRSIGRLVVGCAIAVLFSTVSAFVTLAVFGALLAVACIRRQARAAVAVVLGALVAGVVLALTFGLFVLPKDNAALREFWNRFYLRGGISQHAHDVVTRVHSLTAWFGLPVVIVAVFAGAGVVALVRMGRPATALVLPVLWIEMIVAGRARRYPFLDLRTSHFLLVTTAVVAVIGAAALTLAVARHSRAAAAVLVLAASLGFLHGALPSVRTPSFPPEDVRSQVRYVQAHRRPGDVVVFSRYATWGAAYYWRGAPVELHGDARSTNGFDATIDAPALVAAGDRTAPAVDAALGRAVALARARPGARVWIVRSHVSPAEVHVWPAALARFGLRARVIRTGVEPLLVVDLPVRGAAPRSA